MHQSFPLLIFLLGILLSIPVNSLTTFKAENSIDGQWTFREKSSATFICSIYPYNGFSSFLFNSSSVFHCLGSVCYIIDNKGESFFFQHDITNGTCIFTWKINNMQMKYNKIEIACDDGSASSLRYTITVTVNAGSAKRPQQKLFYIVLIIVIRVINMLK